MIRLFTYSTFIILTLHVLSQPRATNFHNPEFIHNLIEANRQKILGNFDAVKDLYEKCLKINPNSAVVYYELASYYVQINQYETSIKYAERAAKLEPQNIWYKALLGVLYKQTKQYKKAIKIYQLLSEQNTNRIDFLYELAYMYIYSNKLHKALKVFDEIEQKFGLDETIILEKERIYSFKRQYDKSESEIRKLIQLNPNEIRYWGMLAELYIAQRKLYQAEEIYQKMLQLDSTNGLVNLSLADYYRIKGDLEKSFFHLQMAFKSSEIDIDTKLKMLITLSGYAERNNQLSQEVDRLLQILLEYYPKNSKVLTLHADLLLRQNKTKELHQVLLQIIQIDPSKYIIWEQLLLIEHDLQQWDSLLVHSEKAIELFPLNANLYYFKAIAAYELKKYSIADEALSYIQTLPSSNKDFMVEVYALHGEVLHAMGKNAESDSKLEKALEIDKSNKIILNNYSYYLSLRSDSLDKAERMSLICVELEPNNPTFLDTYAWVLYKQNKLEKALEYIERAYRLQNNNAIIIEHYGDILFKLGRYDEALERWNEALKIGKGSPFLEQKIQEKKLIE
ncbi:MAG: tetratricopeptide repeat protein [Bacteroidales bacterium]|nr:tetratricopeptide repeat protein [Bacteroidales bacterium]